jgi:hypothetical protein
MSGRPGDFANEMVRIGRSPYSAGALACSLASASLPGLARYYLVDRERSRDRVSRLAGWLRLMGTGGHWGRPHREEQ